MDKRQRFLRWFAKHHRFYGDCVSIFALYSLWLLVYFLSGIWLLVALGFWYFLFCLFPHCCTERFIYEIAESEGLVDDAK